MSVANSAKNFPISAAGADLGLGQGDELVQNIQDQLDEQRKQRALAAAGGGQAPQSSLAAQSLGLTGSY